MLLGQILFILAALSVAVATAVGLVIGVSRLIAYKIQGRELGPQPEPGSEEWIATNRATTVDVAKKSLLTERYARGARDPVVSLAGVRYRITRLAGARFLITDVTEGRRVGTFELDGSGRHQGVLAEPDDPADAQRVVQIAVLSSHVSRAA